MLRIREFETVAEELGRAGEMPGFIHSCLGQEAVAVGVCSALAAADVVVSTHRNHGHLIAKGGDLGAMFAELYGRTSGTNRGKGGSPRLIDVGIGMLGGYNLIAANIPLAVGAALHARAQGKPTVAVCFFGDGAVNEGILAESLNLAALYRLPVLFVCENNQYSANILSAAVSAPVALWRRGDSYGIPGVSVDGNDVRAVAAAAAEAVERARSGAGPTFMEALTYRLSTPTTRGHAEQRDGSEVAAAWAQEPIGRLRAALLAGDSSLERALAEIEHEVTAEVRSAAAVGASGAWPDARDATQDVLAPARSGTVGNAPGAAPDTVDQTLSEALNAAIGEEMERDATVMFIGIEAGRGGVSGVVKGLLKRFGPGRVVEAPTSEAVMLGAGNGAALVGARPIVETQLMDFSMYPMDQLVNVTAKGRYVSGGRAHIPLVFKTRVNDGGSQHGATHMQSLEALFYHVPGLKLVMPSSPADAKGLMTAAIRDDDPVVFVECAALDRSRAPVPVGEHVVPIGTAATLRPGRDVTLVAFGHTVAPALRVAKELADEDIQVEVLDLRTLVPMDEAAILASVRRTGRLVVFQQASVQGGIGSDICRIVVAQAWSSLKAPPTVVGSRHAPVPYSPPLERAVLYDPEELRSIIRSLAGSASPASGRG